MHRGLGHLRRGRRRRSIGVAAAPAGHGVRCRIRGPARVARRRGFAAHDWRRGGECCRARRTAAIGSRRHDRYRRHGVGRGSGGFRGRNSGGGRLLAGLRGRRCCRLGSSGSRRCRRRRHRCRRGGFGRRRLHCRLGCGDRWNRFGSGSGLGDGIADRGLGGRGGFLGGGLTSTRTDRRLVRRRGGRTVARLDRRRRRRTRR